MEPADDVEVLPARELVLDGFGLAGEADDPAHCIGFTNDVVALDGRGATRGGQQRGQYAYRGGFPRAVGAQQAQDGAAWDGEVCPKDFFSPSTTMAGRSPFSPTASPPIPLT